MLGSHIKLAQLYAQHHGKVTDKWASYLSLYEREFERRRDSVKSLLEVGVQNGGSLEIWGSYFSQAELIVGCDINPKCGELAYDDPRIRVVVGDATQPETKAKILEIASQFDVVIEDGSHIPREVIATFLQLWPHVKPGGVFIAEDLHCDYFATHEGGIKRRDIANRFFAELVHVINFEHWGDAVELRHLIAQFAPSLIVDETQLVGTIESISFSNSIAMVRKAIQPSDATLGSRVIVGEVATADPAVLSVRSLGGDSLKAMRNSGQQEPENGGRTESFAQLFGKRY